MTGDSVMIDLMKPARKGSSKFNIAYRCFTFVSAQAYNFQGSYRG
jgi:hypothetical protein